MAGPSLLSPDITVRGVGPYVCCEPLTSKGEEALYRSSFYEDDGQWFASRRRYSLWADRIKTKIRLDEKALVCTRVHSRASRLLEVDP